jgi:pimeloyl-ACP methyl ester carboxylesterase
VPSIRPFAVVAIVAVIAAMLVSYALSERGLKTLNADVRKDLPGSFIDLPDGVTHYEWIGPKNGKIVVLIHGTTMASYVWDGIADALAASGFRVLRYDSFGRGHSDRPETRYDTDLYDRQLLNLLNALDIKRPVNLVGYSQGGSIAVVFAARRPDRVKRLVLIAPAGFPSLPAYAAKLALVPVLGDWIMKVFGKRIILAMTGMPVHDKSLVPRERARMKEQLAYRGYTSSLLSMLKYYPLHDLAEVYVRTGKHKIPTLIFWGTEDKTVPFSSAKRVLAAMPHADLKALKGSTHSLVYEESSKLAPSIVSFLNQQR